MTGATRQPEVPRLCLGAGALVLSSASAQPGQVRIVVMIIMRMMRFTVVMMMMMMMMMMLVVLMIVAVITIIVESYLILGIWGTCWGFQLMFIVKPCQSMIVQGPFSIPAR